MSLDLSKVVGQIETMALGMSRGRQARDQRLREALALFEKSSGEFARLKAKLERSRVRWWTVAGLYKELNHAYSVSPVPSSFTVIGSDGSHIEVDRHREARCFLLNIGAVTLSYGKNPDAVLESFPHLYFGDENVVIAPPPGTGYRELPIEGSLLDIKRSVLEAQKLAEMGAGLPKDCSALALIDGPLILWGLTSRDYPDFVVDSLLNKGFLIYLDELKRQGRSKRLALAGYTSFPRSSDVVDTLRVSLCPNETADCDRYCKGVAFNKRPCDGVYGVQDRDLFSSVLKPGERSALFVSMASINERYRDHRVYFFYLRMDDEIVRIEVPEWVALDNDLLGLVHSLTLDQCQRGQGYPVALSEAHEQAVVGTSDRENFWNLAESYLETESQFVESSGKSRSKRTRWV
ncbi:MAG: DNA double-strand break repair nuclease NurA [Chloroflexota bacterium]